MYMCICDPQHRVLKSHRSKMGVIYRKIPLIRPGRIYGQRKTLMGLYSGGAFIRGALYSGGKTLQFAIC